MVLLVVGMFQDTHLGVVVMRAIMFISWVGITAGLILYRNSNVLIPAAGFLVAVIMMGFAHGGAQLRSSDYPSGTGT